MRLLYQAERIDSPDDFLEFFRELQNDVHQNPDSWDFVKLAQYVDPLADWINSPESQRPSVVDGVSKRLTWREVALLLMSACHQYSRHLAGALH